MIDRISVVYVKNDIEDPWPIGSSVIYDENQTRQRRDQLYRYGLGQNRNKLSGPIKSCAPCYKNQNDNYMTDRTCVNLIENNTKLSYPIRLGTFMMKTKYDNDITIRIGVQPSSKTILILDQVSFVTKIR